MRRFWAHPFLDGNSRTQRVFFTDMLHDAGFDIDWRAVDADAIHAARHASFLTEDPSWLAAQLRPGLVHHGETTPSLAVTDGLRENTRPLLIFTDMLEHHALGGDGESYTHPDRPHPPSPHEHPQHDVEHETQIHHQSPDPASRAHPTPPPIQSGPTPEPPHPTL